MCIVDNQPAALRRDAESTDQVAGVIEEDQASPTITSRHLQDRPLGVINDDEWPLDACSRCPLGNRQQLALCCGGSGRHKGHHTTHGQNGQQSSEAHLAAERPYFLLLAFQALSKLHQLCLHVFSLLLPVYRTHKTSVDNTKN